MSSSLGEKGVILVVANRGYFLSSQGQKHNFILAIANGGRLLS